MIGVMLKMFGLGFSWIGKGVGSIMSWALGDMRNAIIVAFIGMFAICLFMFWLDERDDTLLIEQQAQEIHSNQQAFTALRIAARDAQIAADQNKARAEAEWRAKLEEASHEQIALRADYDQRIALFLRRQRAGANSSHGAASDLSSPAPMSDGPVQPAGIAIVPERDLNLCAAAFARAQALMDAWSQASRVQTQP